MNSLKLSLNLLEHACLLFPNYKSSLARMNAEYQLVPEPLEEHWHMDKNGRINQGRIFCNINMESTDIYLR